MKVIKDTYLKNVFLLIISVFITVLILEIALRMFYGNQPVFIYPQVMHIPTSYGYKLKPNQLGTYTLDKPVRANSFGFRDYEWSMPKIKGVYRIMCLGDSLTFGNAVRGEDTYPKVLEAQLRSINANYEVISTAIGGWATFIELDFLKAEGMKYEPDAIIIGFYMNDFSIRSDVSVNLTEEGRWDARPLWLKWLPYKYIFIIKRSALITYLRDRIDTLLHGETDFNTLLLKNRINLDNEDSIQATYHYLSEIKKLCDERGIKCILASIPAINYFWFPRGSVKYMDHLKKFCESQGIEFIDLAEGFWKFEDTNKFYMYPWDNHLNPAGHKLVADQLFARLRPAAGLPAAQ